MKAIIWTKYGSPDVLQVQEVEKPTPKHNEVLIKVHAANASRTDTEFRDLTLPFPFALPIRLYIGVIRPTRVRILGTEFAGEVEAIGKDVTEYNLGDQVYGYTGFKMGTYAEYICLPEKPTDELGGVLAKRPTNISYEEAASVPFGGMEALHSLDRVNIQRGQKVLIVGAGGSIGTNSVQLAKHYGAEVTAVDSAGKLDMLRSIGADHVIDYANEDYTKNGEKYDVIIDTIGKSPFVGSVRVLNEHGTYLNDNPSIIFQLRKGFASSGSNKKILAWKGVYSSENLLRLKELIEQGATKPVVDRTYTLEQITEAHRYVETDQKKGNVVITVI
ncbi:MAG TPA: NAD(P)-dependent alcohol dehydrogenase [Anaerolineales bacterium]|nr:NAD(P)-dependent alcohol dehydrogenase [Anaerolineales bacterium]